jgi:hypothetical protein
MSPLEKRRADSVSKAEMLNTAQRYFLCPLLFLCAVDSVWAVDRSRHISQYERTAWRGRTESLAARRMRFHKPRMDICGLERKPAW